MANTFVFSDTYLGMISEKIKNDISYALYKAEGIWFSTDVESVSLLSDGRVEISLYLGYGISDELNITEIALYAQDEICIGSITVNITKTEENTGLLYIIRCSLLNVVANSENTGAYDEV